MDSSEPSSTSARIGAWAIVLALVAVLARLVAPTFGEVMYQPQSDDGYYLRYMHDVARDGVGAFPDLFRFYLGDSHHWIFPPPSRVGFTLVSALFSLVFGVRMETLSYVSLASHLALVVVTFAFARRWFETTKAVLVAALTAFSPLLLGLSRLALTDAFISLTQVTAIWLFAEFVRDPTRWMRQVAFAAAFAFSILSKEISVLLAIPFAVHAAVERFQRKRDVPIGRTLVLLAAPVVASCVVWVVAAGGPGPLVRVMKIVIASPATNEYAIAYGSGGWFRYPIDELLMSPWPTVLGLAAIAIAAWRWRRGEYGSLAVAMSLVYLCQVAVLSFFTQNLRYVAVLEVPLRVLAVTLLWELFDAKRSARGRLACVAVVVLLCVLDYFDYAKMWRQMGLLDAVSFELTRMRGLRPME